MGKKQDTSAQAQAAGEEHLDQKQEVEQEDLALSEMEIETLAGDIRDAMLMRIRDIKRPWTMLTEEEQTDLANGMEMAARDMTRAAVRLLTAWEWPRVVVDLGEVKIIGGDKARIEAKVVAPNYDAYRNVLGEHAGQTVMLIAVDSETFMGEKEPVQIDPNQPDLPVGEDGEDEHQDAIYIKAVDFVVHEQKASTSQVQRRLAIGYNRAVRLIERMEEEGIVSAADHVGKRTVLRKPDDKPEAA
jgi:DNA segregation ATPase FtsK/SpoIIIE-like protein